MRILMLTALLIGCGDKDDTAAADTTASAEGECADLCIGAGFTDSTADEYDHELNCFCSGGSGTVEQDACTTMCEGLGWSGGDAFSAEACQCY